MKKVIWLCFLFLNVATSVSAQSVWAKAGPNFATIGGDASGVESKVGLHAGLFMKFNQSDKFTITPEVVYSGQGAQSSQNSDLKINYNYVNIGLIFNYYPGQKFFIQAGPQLGILASAKITDGTNTTSVKDELNGTDFSFGFGMGLDFGNFMLNGRYNLGISNTIKDTANDEKYTNSVFQISLATRLHTN
jgi:hypothetical protein